MIGYRQKVLFSSSMAYPSSLTDREWEILGPLLLKVLPPKKQTNDRVRPWIPY